MHVWVAHLAILGSVVIVLGDELERLFEHLPKLDGLVFWGGKEQQKAISLVCSRTSSTDALTICAKQKVGGVLPPAPLDLVDLFLDLERFEVVELGLVGLELGVELVLAALFLMGLHGG